jgi:FkbM family methyltransferase
MLLKYLRESFARKKARRQFNVYGYQTDTFDLPGDGIVQFANWQNPLILPKKLVQSEINFFRQFIPKGSMAIDIGGNIGDTTVPMGLAAGKEGLVLGFDPNPHVFKILEANAGLNKEKTNIVALPFAIADKEGEFYYTSSEASYSNGGITEVSDNYHGSFVLPQKVKGIILKNYLEKEYGAWLPKLSFIKIDAEGYDKEIIKSIAGLISQCKPVIISECFTELSPEERFDLYDSLAKHNYDLYYFQDFAEGTNTQLLTRSDMTKWKTFNLYALPKKG